MIPAHCHTNLDAYKNENWPTQFPVVPLIGHRVEAESGKTLVIVGVTWAQRDWAGQAGRLPGAAPRQMYLRIELHHG